MSLYNQLFGFNNTAHLVLEVLQINPKTIERFRNAGINFKKDYLWIYTRTGSCYSNKMPNEVLTTNHYYKNKQDDSFDKTYALYFFSIPDKYKAYFEDMPVDELPDWKTYFDNFDAEKEAKKVPELMEFLLNRGR